MAEVAIALWEDFTVFCDYIPHSSNTQKIRRVLFAWIHRLRSPFGFIEVIPTDSAMFLQLFLVVLHWTSHYLNSYYVNKKKYAYSKYNVAVNWYLKGGRTRNFLLMVAMHDYYYCILTGVLHYNTRTKYLPKEPLTDLERIWRKYQGLVIKLCSTFLEWCDKLELCNLVHY